MINGLGVVGWEVGGIGAEAACSAADLNAAGGDRHRLAGELPRARADLVLTVTGMLRKRGRGKFVDIGPGLDALPVADRATLADMSRVARDRVLPG